LPLGGHRKKSRTAVRGVDTGLEEQRENSKAFSLHPNPINKTKQKKKKKKKTKTPGRRDTQRKRRNRSPAWNVLFIDDSPREKQPDRPRRGVGAKTVQVSPNTARGEGRWGGKFARRSDRRLATGGLGGTQTGLQYG